MENFKKGWITLQEKGIIKGINDSDSLGSEESESDLESYFEESIQAYDSLLSYAYGLSLFGDQFWQWPIVNTNRDVKYYNHATSHNLDVWKLTSPNTRIMVYNGHLITATLETLDFFVIF